MNSGTGNTSALMVANSRPDEGIRDPSMTPTTVSRQVFRPERIFLIAGHGQETREPVTASSRYFQTTIKNGEVVESEFPRFRCPLNTFMVNSTQPGVADQPSGNQFQSFGSLITHRDTTPDGKIHIPNMTSSYGEYKKQIYELGNETFDKTHGRQVDIDLNVYKFNESDPQMRFPYFHNQYVADILLDPRSGLGIQEGMTSNEKDAMELAIAKYKMKSYRFRSHGPIRNTTNIQQKEDTFYFFSPNATITTNAELGHFEPGELDEEFIIRRESTNGLMPSGVIPLVNFVERFPTLFSYFSAYAFISSIFREHTFGDLYSNMETYIREYPQAKKERFLSKLKASRQFNDDDVFSNSSDLDTRLSIFLKKQIDNMRKHWVWGISLTNEEFNASTFHDIAEELKTTEQLVNSLIEKVGNHEPLLIISYHCRSLLVEGERANLSSFGDRVREVIARTNISNNQRNALVKAIHNERKISPGYKSTSKAWQNVIQQNAETGEIGAKKLFRLAESPSTAPANGQRRFGQLLSRSMSYGPNPYWKTGGRRKSRVSRKSRIRSTRKKLNRRNY
jgi:hypothetical protein